jgi:uncharacterized membrane protein HdeD (DUF308 family)
MKQFFKNLKVGMLLSGLISIALGLVMICLPEIVETTLRFVLGGGLTLFGILEIVFVFVKPNGLLSAGRIIPGVLSLAVGLVFLFRFDTFVSLLWILLGISILTDGIYKLQYAFELKAAAVKNWWINLLISFSSLLMAAVLMIQPFDLQNAMTVFAGILLAVNGVFDVVCTVLMSVYAKRMQGVATTLIQDAEENEQGLVEK